VFQYRPKFVDIRVRPPTPEEEEAKAANDDVWKLKPGETPCEWTGCRHAATAKAPKSRDLPGQFYGFCQQHAAEYNRNWDYFAGMSEGEMRRQQAENLTGGRPTWQFKASRFSREAAAFASKFGMGKDQAGGYADPFNMFGGRRPETGAGVQTRALGKMERQALSDLDLDDAADKDKIRARYTELVKRCHPDANGGDRSAETKLQRVIKAYKTLKKAKLA
jgi:DnaJ domain